MESVLKTAILLLKCCCNSSI